MGRFRWLFDYLEFEQGVITETRYRYNAANEEFLRTVEETGQRRMILLPEGTVLYRAQLAHELERVEVPSGRHYVSPYPAPPSRMIPLRGSAKDGRVNPKGIPCLYLADQPETAMSEVRPWLGAYLSLGHFRTVRDLKLMNCTTPNNNGFSHNLLSGDTSPGKLEEQTWGRISDAFSEPVNPTDMTAEYAPTQILAEVFKQMGCDGIKYRSLLGEGGCSFALFSLDDAKLFRCDLCVPKKIKHEFKNEGESYIVTTDGRAIKLTENEDEKQNDQDEEDVVRE